MSDRPARLRGPLEPGNADTLDDKLPNGLSAILNPGNVKAVVESDAIDPALKHTELTLVELTGVSHVLKDDPTDAITNYARDQPLSPQVVGALKKFVGPIA